MKNRMEIPAKMIEMYNRTIESVYNEFENQLYFELLKLKDNKLFLLESNIYFSLSSTNLDWRRVSYICINKKDDSIMVGLMCDEDEEGNSEEYEVKFNILNMNVIKEIYQGTYKELHVYTSSLNRDLLVS